MRDNKKIRKCIRVIGVSGAVYMVFRYLLPLAAPFLFAWMTALVLKPSAYAIAGKLKVSWRGRSFGVPAGVVGLAELAFLIAWAAGLFYVGGKRLYEEVAMLANRFPWFLEQLDLYLTGVCRQLEGALSLKQDTMVRMARDMIRSLVSTLKQGVMPYLMGNSVNIAKYCIQCCILGVLYIIGVLLFIQEIPAWKEKTERSLYSREFERIGRLLQETANAYLRTQGIIMVLTSIVCMAGFFLLKNPYYILAGAGIGILDALPVFGTGTVLIPWTLFCLLRGRWGRGAAIFAIYLVCYFLREILEARLMANQVGLTPLETLISIYAGLQLFGLWGFLLGPLGILLVKEFTAEEL
ncbi:MAG: AI-2E family transporter [Hungatella sp.]|nr:AI-2E family transporter [Hungatella sp.]